MSELPTPHPEPPERRFVEAASDEVVEATTPDDPYGAAPVGPGLDVRALADAIRSLATAFREQRDLIEAMVEREAAQQAAIEALGRRIGELRQVTVDLVEAQHSVVEHLESGTDSRLDELTRAVSEPIEIDLGPIEEQLQSLRGSLPVAGGAGATDIDRTAEPGGDRAPPVDLAPLQARLDEIAAAIADRSPGPDLGPIHDLLDEVLAAVKGVPAVDLAPVHEQLQAIAASGGTDLAPIERRLDEISAALATPPAVDLEPLTAALESIRGGLDRLTADQQVDHGRLLESLHHRIDTIQSALEDPVEVDLAPVVERIEALAEAVDVEAVHDLLDRLRGPSVLGTLEDRVGRLVRSIPKPSDFDLPGMRRQLEAIAGDLADLVEVPPPVDLGPLQRRLDDVAAHLGIDTARTPPSGSEHGGDEHEHDEHDEHDTIDDDDDGGGRDDFGDLSAFDDFDDENLDEDADDAYDDDLAD